MRIGLRGAFGQTTITPSDDATVGDLSTQISEASSLPAFDLKFGFPPKALDLTQFDAALKLVDTGLKLNGERIQVDSRKVESKLQSPLSHTTPTHATPLPGSSTSITSQPAKPLSLKKRPNKVEEDPPALALSDGTYLVHRVMPDDNSCLFRALSKCLLGSEVDGMVELRSSVAQGIQADTERFNAIVLEREPDDYCRWIQTDTSWGGATEIIIVAEAFGVEVCAVNLEDCSVQRFNEGRPMRVYLVYSGIHWDALAANAIGKNGPPEIDVTQFDAADVEIEQKAVEVGKVLSERGYFTNTSKFGVKCNTCGWLGKGEKAALEHATKTGHSDFGES